MPFTVTHIAATLPFAWISRWKLPLSALVAGAIIPDFAGYDPWLLDYQATHSFRGVISHCMPIGTLLYYSYHAFLKQPFFDLFPTEMTSRMRPWIDQPIKLNPIAIFVVLFCVTLGATTHVFWDYFTHPQSWGVKQFPDLRQVAHEDPVERARIPSGLVWIAFVVLAIDGAVYYQHYLAVHPRTNWLSALTVSAKRISGFVFFVFLVYSIGMNVLWWRERSRPLHIIHDQSGPV